MENLNQPKLSFEGVSILHLSFESLKAFTPEDEIDFTINPYVFYPMGSDGEFQLILQVELGSSGVFTLNFVATGVFRLSVDLTEDLKERFVNANSVAIMFPYIRAFISTFTANVGKVVSPILIPTQFFTGVVEELTLEKFNSLDENLQKVQKG